MIRRGHMGQVLTWIARIIFAGLAVVILFIASGNEFAVWVGGWFLLFFGLPLLAVALLFSIAGSALRKRRAHPNPTAPEGDECAWKPGEQLEPWTRPHSPGPG